MSSPLINILSTSSDGNPVVIEDFGFPSSYDRRPTSFLDLPVEIREQIYGYLLIPVEEQVHNGSFGQLDSVRIQAEGNQEDAGLKLALYRDRYINGLRHPIRRDPIHVAILRTCKIILAEAAPVLYGSNVFTVVLSRQVPTTANQQLSPFTSTHVSQLCTTKRFVFHHRAPDFLDEASPVSFLAQIGERNVALLRHLDLWSFSTSTVGEYMLPMSRTVMEDMPELRTVVFGLYSLDYEPAYNGQNSYSVTWFEAERGRHELDVASWVSQWTMLWMGVMAIQSLPSFYHEDGLFLDRNNTSDLVGVGVIEGFADDGVTN